MRSPWRDAPRRRVGWYVLIALVVGAHALLGAVVEANVIGWNTAVEPKRIEVAFVKELAPAAPPTVAPTMPPPRATRSPRAAPTPRPAASAASVPIAASAPASAAAETPRPGASEAAEGLPLVQTAPDQTDDPGPQLMAARAAAAASAASAAASAAPDALPGPPQPQLDWPPSTRLSYTLTGRFRDGPLYGNAVVAWRRDGAHYQVEFFFDVAPFFTQRMFSDGEIAADGLRPQRYDETRKFPLHAPLVKRIGFEDDAVLLNNGKRVPRLPQSQDPASQFVQFVWLFTVHPDWLVKGHPVQIPLALPNNLRVWQYEVGDAEDLVLPFGTVRAVHVLPIGEHKPGELPFEIWAAPTLQYLPVRIHVPIDEHNFIDLQLDARPLQAAAGGAEPPSAPAPSNWRAPPPLRDTP